jgi:hypothetical protein
VAVSCYVGANIAGVRIKNQNNGLPNQRPRKNIVRFRSMNNRCRRARPMCAQNGGLVERHD